jgi:hypothetical protein
VYRDLKITYLEGERLAPFGLCTGERETERLRFRSRSRPRGLLKKLEKDERVVYILIPHRKHSMIDIREMMVIDGGITLSDFVYHDVEI